MDVPSSADCHAGWWLLSHSGSGREACSRPSRKVFVCSVGHSVGASKLLLTQPKTSTGYFMCWFSQCRGSGNHPQMPLPGKSSGREDFPTLEYCQNILLLQTLPVHSFLGYSCGKNWDNFFNQALWLGQGESGSHMTPFSHICLPRLLGCVRGESILHSCATVGLDRAQWTILFALRLLQVTWKQATEPLFSSFPAWKLLSRQQGGGSCCSPRLHPSFLLALRCREGERVMGGSWGTWCPLHPSCSDKPYSNTSV